MPTDRDPDDTARPERARAIVRHFAFRATPIRMAAHNVPNL